MIYFYFAFICMCVTFEVVVHRGWKKELEMELQVAVRKLSHNLLLLGTETVSSGKAASTLTIEPSLQHYDWQEF